MIDDFDSLLEALPLKIQKSLHECEDASHLLEVVMDLGRSPEARFPNRDIILNSSEVTEEDISYVTSRISPFGDDNRAGIERTLHRISCLRNRSGKIVGLTCRMGRAVFGTIKIIEDIVHSEKNILLLGRPGVGKTTMLREISRVLADDARKRVIIVDTSNEIAGSGDIPHPALGKARRMQVKTPAFQHGVMIEAVENHMPEVIIIDEMGTELEATAARTIAERGVQLIATAHGNSLDNLIMNPTLSDLVGGVQTVTLGDNEARRRRTQKTILERKAPPTFDVVIEIQSWEKVALHPDVASTVDLFLRGFDVSGNVRELNESKEVQLSKGEPFSMSTSQKAPIPLPQKSLRPEDQEKTKKPIPKSYRIMPFGVGKDKILHVAKRMGESVSLVSDILESDMLVITKAHYRKKSDMLRRAEDSGKPVYVLKKNSLVQIEQFMKKLCSSVEKDDAPQLLAAALTEAGEAAHQILNGEPSIELSPQVSFVRKLQHQLAERYNLASASAGREPKRRVIMYQPD